MRKLDSCNLFGQNFAKDLASAASEEFCAPAQIGVTSLDSLRLARISQELRHLVMSQRHYPPFQLIGVGNFGEGRPFSGSPATKWTGQHKYGVYKHNRQLLIIESHGGGEQGYFDHHSHAIELFDQLCSTLSPELIWDICYLIATTENRTYRKGRHELSTLFLQGRLKRRRRNKTCRLEILPAPATPRATV